MPRDLLSDDDAARLEVLVRKLGETEREIQEIAQNKIDAVVLPEGLPFLLSDAQDELRKRTELARRFAEQRRAILDAMPFTVVLVDENGDVVEENAAGPSDGFKKEQSLIGFNYFEVCAQAQDDRQAIEDANAISDGIRGVINGERPRFEHLYLCNLPGKSDCWFHAVAVPLGEDTTSGAVIIHLDVTAEYREARRLRTEGRRFRELFDLSPLPMWVCDRETLQIIAVNQAAVEHYGWDSDTFCSMTALDMRPPEDRDRLREHLAARDSKTEQDEVCYEGDWQHLKKDGSRINVEVSTRLLEFQARPARLLLARDVTAARRRDAVQAAERAVLADLSKRASLDTLLQTTAISIEQALSEARVGLLMLDASGRKLRYAAAPNLPHEHVAAVEGMVLDSSTGMVSEAMMRGESAIDTDIGEDPQPTSIEATAAAHDFRTCWAEPILDSRKRVLGCFVVYFHDSRAPADWEQALLDKLASLVGIGIERRRQDEAVRRSEKNLAKLFRETAAGLAVISDEGVFAQANAVLLDMLGVEAKRLEKLNFFSLVNPVYRKQARNLIRQILAGSTASETLEAVFQRHQGSKFWMLVRFSPKSGRDGRPESVIAVFDDITERKNAEMDRDANWARQRVAGRIARVGSWSIDASSRKVQWSQEIYKILGWEGDEPPSLAQGYELYSEPDQERMKRALDQCLQEGSPFELELQIQNLAERELNVRVAGEAQWDGAGSIVQIVGAFQDITEIKRLSERGEDLRRQLERIMENMSGAIFLLDKQWSFVFLNHQAERVLSRNREDLLDRNIWDEFPEARDTEAFEVYHRAMATGRAEQVEFFYPPLDEWFEANAVPSPDGLAVYFTVTTETRKLQAQLEQAQRLESIGQLTGGIAHDFNNLLTVISGNSELLMDSLADDDQEMASMINDASRRGAELTQRLLAFARRQPLAPEPTDIHRLISNMTSLLRSAIGEAVDMEQIRGAGLWPAMIDASQFESALMNLAINARDAMPDGGKLTIETTNVSLDNDYRSTHPDVETGQYVMVVVSDTGTGMAPDILDQVVEPFFTTKPTGSGSGLGLSMVYGFAKQSGGQVNIYSEPGEGTTVRLYLPRATNPADRSETLPQQSADGQGERILLVEDDELVRSYAARVLGQIGYDVCEAESGDAALAILEKDESPFDLLFSDVVMPGRLNGPELAKNARKQHPEIRVLFTSGYTENAIVHQGRLDRGVRLLNKPYRRDQLAKAVRDALDAPPDEG